MYRRYLKIAIEADTKEELDIFEDDITQYTANHDPEGRIWVDDATIDIRVKNVNIKRNKTKK